MSVASGITFGMRRYDVTDEQWVLIEDLFPKRAKTGRPRKEPREALNAIFWILNTGAPWRDLPEDRFGPWETVYTHFRKWRDCGLFDRILSRLHAKLDEEGRLDFGLWCVDGSIARATRAAAGAPKGKKGEPSDHALGRSRGGYSTKFHLVCDGAGLPLAVELTPGQTHDSKAFEKVMNSALERVGRQTSASTRKASPQVRGRRQGL
jgi:transposase